MILVQRNSPNFPAQFLLARENTVETGAMSDCVSVIVFFNPDAQGTYADVRGYHGGGGLENVNFGSLLGGVPNVATTQVFLVSGTHQGSMYARESNCSTIRSALVAAHLGAARMQFFHAIGRARFNRRGQRM